MEFNSGFKGLISSLNRNKWSASLASPFTPVDRASAPSLSTCQCKCYDTITSSYPIPPKSLVNNYWMLHGPSYWWNC